MFLHNNKLDTNWLAQVSFFEGFNEADLEAVSKLGERVSVKAGTQLIDQGRVGDDCYVIVEGQATVSIRGEFVAAVGPGTMVGEMALIEHRPRNASVVAETDMELVSFGTAELNKLMEKSPELHQRVTSLLTRRLSENLNR